MSQQQHPSDRQPHNPTKAILIILACLALLISTWVVQYIAHFFFRTNENHERLVRHIIATNKIAGDFNTLFPSSQNFITYYNQGATPTTWSSKTGLFGKYELTMQFKISIDFTGQTGHQVSKPEFYINEIESISYDGRYTTSYTGRTFNLNAKNWPELVKHNGNFSSIGITLIKDAPVPGFDDVFGNRFNGVFPATRPSPNTRLPKLPPPSQPVPAIEIPPNGAAPEK